MVVNDRRARPMVALLAKNFTNYGCAANSCNSLHLRCIREMLVCIDKIRVIREIRGLKEKVGNFSNLTSLSNKVDDFIQQSRRVCIMKQAPLVNAKLTKLE